MSALTDIPAELGKGGAYLDQSNGEPNLYSLLVEHKDALEQLMGTDDAVDAHPSVRGATTTNLAFTRAGNILTANANGALAAIDGLTYVVGEEILIKDQSATEDNGPYVVTSLGGASAKAKFTRRADANTSDKVSAGMEIFVSEGTLNANKTFKLTTDDPIVLNTTGLTFTAAPTLADLASTSASLGASLIGIQDAAGQITATTVETALAELAAKFAAGLVPAITKLQLATGTLVAGEATINTNIVVTANSYVIAMPTADITGSTNFGSLSNTRASNVAGAAGAGSVLIRALGADGAKDADAAGPFVALIIN